MRQQHGMKSDPLKRMWSADGQGASSAESYGRTAGARKSPRFESHSAVEIRTKSWNPFSTRSAVLLDISWEGYKVEFLAPLKPLKPGSTMLMSLPLAPFQISEPSHIQLKLTVKWFDSRMYRVGGIFERPNESTVAILDKIIRRLMYLREQRIRAAAAAAAGE